MHIKVKFPVALSILCLCACVVAVSQLRHSGLSVSAGSRIPVQRKPKCPVRGVTALCRGSLVEAFREAAFLPSSFPGAEVHRGAGSLGTSGTVQLLSTIS